MADSWLTTAAALGRTSAPPVLWSAALVIGVAYVARAAAREGLDPRVAYWAGVVAVVIGLLGAWALGQAVYGSGSSAYGGLLAGTVAALLFVWARRQPVWAYADALTPAGALGYAVARLGCFFNGDDYGVAASGFFSVRYRPGTEAYDAQVAHGLIAPGAAWSSPILATQLLHAALGLAIFFLLRRPRRPAGRRLALFAVFYGVGRFAVEIVRGDARRCLGPLSIHQVISLGLIVVGALAISRQRRRGWASEQMPTSIAPPGVAVGVAGGGELDSEAAAR
ncbi:MAG TPA: prolipoprotein diacylglyceryl transferase family protein [Polyangia bacterium]